MFAQVRYKHSFRSKILLICLFLFPISLLAQPGVPVSRGVNNVSDAVEPYIIDIDLRQLPAPVQWQPGDPIKEVPRRRDAFPVESKEPTYFHDPLLERQARATPPENNRAFDTTLVNMNGQGFSGVNPPDTVGDIGRDYFIQSINAGTGATYVIYNKSDGSVAAGPFSMDALGSGNCGSGLGDPIILYDHLAERWMISEFAGSGNFLCVYVSQTSDPIAGGWYAYSFATPSFPDYPHYGVWPDAYYVATNENGRAIYAMDRNQMLAGAPATMQRFLVPDLAGFGFNVLTPADLDGDAPPPGSPGIIMGHRDDEVHNAGSNDPSQDWLDIYELEIDFATPANSNLVGPNSVGISEFDSNLCGLTSFNCFPMPGSATTLDPLREVIMNRLTYRNFGSHQTLVGNHVTDVDGTDHGGVRWWELRKTGGGWGLQQEGTYAPDGDSRWMAGIGMDTSGNIALAYNVSSTSTFPSIRYAGREAADPPGTLPNGEHVIVDGTSANGSNRWGDYSAMGVDPVDGCTFWFTGEYSPGTQWSTRIASFRFDNCGCTQPDAANDLAATANGDNRIDLSWSAISGAASYDVYRTSGSCPQTSFTLIAAGVVGTSFSDTTVSGNATYSYAIKTYSATEDCRSGFSNCSDATATGACLLPPDFDGIQSVVNSGETQCSLELSWSAATDNCNAGISYNVYRSTEAVFQPDSGNLIASCLNSTSYIDNTVDSFVTYYYIVRAEDQSGNGSGPCGNGNEETNTITLFGTPAGPPDVVLTDDLENGTANWVFEAGPADPGGTAPWALSTTQANSPTHSLFCLNETSTKDQVVRTASALSITPASTLEFWHRIDTEPNWDGVVLEYSTDGSTWNDILTGNPDRFIQGGYFGPFSGGPLSGRPGWHGNHVPFSKVIVDLADFANQAVWFRFRMACDTSQAVNGYWLDDFQISAATACTTETFCDTLSSHLPEWNSLYTILDFIPCYNIAP